MLKTKTIYFIGCNSDIDCYCNIYINKIKPQDFEYCIDVEIDSFSTLIEILLNMVKDGDLGFNEIYEIENLQDFMVEILPYFDKYGLLK